MHGEHKPLPAWHRVFNLPELCNIILISLLPTDLATLARVSRSFHEIWTPRLWRSIGAIRPGTRMPSPENIVQQGHLVREIRLKYLKRRNNHLQQMTAFENFLLHCQNLLTVDFDVLDYGGSSVFLERFLNLPSEEMFPNSNDATSFIPGRTVLELSRSPEKCREDDEDDSGWFRRLIPSTPKNGFLSSSIRSLRIASNSVFSAVVVAWITRAGWEGHLQGIVQFQLDTNTTTWSSQRSSVRVEKELFLQFLESLPRLEELIAPQVEVVADIMDRGLSRINADILDANHPAARSMAARRQQELRTRKLALWSLGLDLIDEKVSSMTLSSLNTAPSRALSRFPFLTELNLLAESIVWLADAVAYRSQSLQQKWSRGDYRYNNKRDNSSNNFIHLNASGIAPITHLTLRKNLTETRRTFQTMATLTSWKSLFLSPALRLETLDLNSCDNVPGDLLDHLVTSGSIMSLKRVLFSQYCGSTIYPMVDSTSVLRFLRSALSLEEFQCPRTTAFVVHEIFTPEESARWPCRDKLMRLRILSSRVDLQGSETDCAQMRRWLWSFSGRLNEVIVRGVNATVDILIDPSPSVATTTALGELSSCPLSSLLSSPAQQPQALSIETLILPDFLEYAKLTLPQTQQLLEQSMPRLKSEGAFCRYDDEALLWLMEERPEIYEDHMMRELFS